MKKKQKKRSNFENAMEFKMLLSFINGYLNVQRDGRICVFAKDDMKNEELKRIFGIVINGLVLLVKEIDSQ